MTSLGCLTPDHFGKLLHRDGVILQAGPFRLSVRTSLQEVRPALHQLYADFPFLGDDWADYHGSLRPVWGPRRYLKPQIQFLFDGAAPFFPFPRDSGLPLLEWGLNWCIYNHAHHYLLLHAAVVERDGKAILLPGTTGAGKTTLCAALIGAGWRLFSDEIAALDLATGLVWPVVRPLCLKEKAIELVQERVPHAVFGPVFHGTRKGRLSHLRPPAEAVHRMTEPAEPAFLIFPAYRAGADARLDAMPGGRAFLAAATSAFNYHVLGAEGFEALARLIDACAAYAFSYSSLDDALAIFDQLIPRSKRTLAA